MNNYFSITEEEAFKYGNSGESDPFYSILFNGPLKYTPDPRITKLAETNPVTLSKLNRAKNQNDRESFKVFAEQTARFDFICVELLLLSENVFATLDERYNMYNGNKKDFIIYVKCLLDLFHGITKTSPTLKQSVKSKVSGWYSCQWDLYLHEIELSKREYIYTRVQSN